MTRFIDGLTRIYSLLLRLYPGTFQSEFYEQMLLDFTDMALDAGKKGRLSFFLFCLRELVDLPINLLKVHLKEGRMIRVFHSQPVNMGMRSGLVFGFAFGLYILMYELALWIAPNLENFIPAQVPNAVVSPLLDWIGFVLTGLVFGSMIVLWLALLGGIFVFARKYHASGQMIWITVVGAIGNLISRGVILRGAYSFMHPLPPEGLLYDHPAFWSVALILMAAYIVCGILLGFLLGWLLEAQKSGELRRIMA